MIWLQYLTDYPIVMWSEETCHMVQNLSFELLVPCESLNYPLSRTFTWIFSDIGIKSYWCSKAIKNKEKQNYDVNFFNLCSFTLWDMWQVFPDHITISVRFSFTIYNLYSLSSGLWNLCHSGFVCFSWKFAYDALLQVQTKKRNYLINTLSHACSWFVIIILDFFLTNDWITD